MKVEEALARGVALLGVKVTGIKPPRLTFVTVYPEDALRVKPPTS